MPYKKGANNTLKKIEQRKYETLLASVMKSAVDSDDGTYSFAMVFVGFEDDRLWSIQDLPPHGLVAAACEYTDYCANSDICFRKWKLSSDDTRNDTQKPVVTDANWRPTKRYLKIPDKIKKCLFCCFVLNKGHGTSVGKNWREIVQIK